MLKRIIIICALLFTVLSVAPANAALPSIVPEGCRGQANVTGTTEVCNLNTVTLAVLNVAQIILGLAGSVALLMFVYGGFLYILAGGKPDLVAKAKSVFTYSIVGLVIILTSGLIMKAIFNALGA